MNVIANQNPQPSPANPQNVAFKGTAYSDRGNQYQKTHLSKAIGAGAGLVIGGSTGVTRIASLKDKNSAFYKSALEVYGKEAIDRVVEGSKTFKGKAAAFIGGGLIPALVGLGIGAIVDYCVNKNRAEQADNKAIAASKNNVVA